MGSHLLFLITSLFFISCTTDKNSYFPLDEGLNWRYAVIITTKDGITRQKYMLVNQSPKYLEDQKSFVRKSLDGTLLHYRETEEGVIFIGKEDTSGMEPVFTKDEHYVFKYPLTIGTEWEKVTLTRLLIKTGSPQKTVFKIIAEVPVISRVESVSDTVKVPAGIFHNCVKITMKGHAYKNAGNYIGLTVVSVNETSWYAPGVGLIKLVREESTESHALDKGTMIIELEKFG
jgi:hypothetical protein